MCFVSRFFINSMHAELCGFPFRGSSLENPWALGAIRGLPKVGVKCFGLGPPQLFKVTITSDPTSIRGQFIWALTELLTFSPGYCTGGSSDCWAFHPIAGPFTARAGCRTGWAIHLSTRHSNRLLCFGLFTRILRFSAATK